MTSIHVDFDRIEWTPGSAYKGPSSLYSLLPKVAGSPVSKKPRSLMR
jgi:hypothetical protein